MTATKKVAIYARVSTDDQTIDNQMAELRRVADDAGWEVAAVYTDEGVSGGKGRLQRPQFNAMLKDAVRRKFSMVMVWSVDRLGRSTQDLANFLAEMHSMNTDLYIYKQAIDTTTSHGKVMFDMFALFADFEREMIKTRTKAGLERAKAQGKRLGQKPVGSAKEAEILEHWRQGMGKKKIARTVGCGVGTVMRVVRAEEDDDRAVVALDNPDAA